MTLIYFDDNFQRHYVGENIWEAEEWAKQMEKSVASYCPHCGAKMRGDNDV